MRVHRALRVVSSHRRGSSRPIVVETAEGPFLTKLRGAAHALPFHYNWRSVTEDSPRSTKYPLGTSPLAKNDPLVLSRIDPADWVVIVRRRRTRSPQLCLGATIRAGAVGL